jgi:glycosyltransferase involved in cell wall biosynthesis
MKVLFLSDNFPPETNAPATRLYEHALHWIAQDVELTVITCFPNFPKGKIFEGYVNRWRSVEVKEGIRVVRVYSYMAANKGTWRRMLDYGSFMITSFLAGLREPRPDLIAATTPQFLTAVSGCALSIVRRLPFVLEVRDLWPASIDAVGAARSPWFLRILEKIELGLYRRAARIVVVTDAFKSNLVKRGVPEDKISVVPHGVDLRRYFPRAKDPSLLNKFELSGKQVVGYLGTHGMAHKLETVLAAAELLRTDPRVCFLLVGDGAEKSDLKKNAAKRGLTNVRFVDACPKDQMPGIWSLCDVALVCLRNSEVFRTVMPSKIFEAMAMGVPLVISAPAGEATSLVKKNGAGVAVDPEDANALAAAVSTLLNDPARHRMFASGASAEAGEFDRGKMASRLLSVFFQSINGRAGTR